MTWFKVDDSFYDHPKAFDASDAAIALWLRAGTWSARNLTDGFVPTGMLARLSTTPDAAAGELTARGLWKKARGGYRFHDWADYQPTREEATAGKKKLSAAGALGNHRRWHVVAGKVDPECRYCRGDGPDRVPPTNDQRTPDEERSKASGTRSGSSDEDPSSTPGQSGNPASDQQEQVSPTRSGGDRVGEGVPESPPIPPDPARPVLKGGSSTTVTHDRAHASPPPSRCPEHLTDPSPPPCRNCGDARKAREQHDRNAAAALARIQSERARDQAAASRAAIDACRLCDQHGQRDGRLCLHDPDLNDRSRRGAAAARAAIRPRTA
ncbi:hypothetical protein ACIBJE_02165 [Micromonospora sp. NPDC050187]|uniref:hypothetical protein n=1 Tax=Micromonospora sp. NPDC050187 TaxID=3364277 RepID=UPI00379686C0